MAPDAAWCRRRRQDDEEEYVSDTAAADDADRLETQDAIAEQISQLSEA